MGFPSQGFSELSYTGEIKRNINLSRQYLQISKKRVKPNEVDKRKKYEIKSCIPDIK